MRQPGRAEAFRYEVADPCSSAIFDARENAYPQVDARLPLRSAFEEHFSVAEHSLIFRDIAMVFTAALVCGLVAWRLRQPLILGYVLAGLILSPFTPGLRVHDVHTFETMAEIGVILLMFSNVCTS